MRDQRLGLGAEDEFVAGIGGEKRLDADPVPAKPQCAFPPVEIGEGKHAVEPRYAPLRAPIVQCLEHDLGVAGAAKLHAFPLEVAAQFVVVVNLTVIDEDASAILGEHRLGGCLAEVEDREPTMAEGHAPLLPNAHTVGATMRNRGKHCIYRMEVRLTAVMTPDTDQAAHDC
jgi:hypothetical protein